MASGWNLCVWLVSVVVRRYIIDILIIKYDNPHNKNIIITFPYSTCISSFFGSIINPEPKKPAASLIQSRKGEPLVSNMGLMCVCVCVCSFLLPCT